jgi:hypothetical protein
LQASGHSAWFTHAWVTNPVALSPNIWIPVTSASASIELGWRSTCGSRPGRGRKPIPQGPGRAVAALPRIFEELPPQVSIGSSSVRRKGERLGKPPPTL